MLIIVYIIFSLGFLMVFSTASADLLDHAREEGLYTALFRQLFNAAGGVVLAMAIYFVGWRRWLAWSRWLLALFTLLLLCTLLPGIGRSVNGARRWLFIGGFSFQPSEFFKYVVPLYLIDGYLRCNSTINSWHSFGRLLLPLVPALFFIWLEPNNGTLLVLLAIITALLFSMGIGIKYWLLPILCVLCVSIIGLLTMPYVSARLEVYWHPERDLLGRGHQSHQAKIAVGSGGLFGKGPGNSWQKLSYLPEAQNDYIAAIFGEEFGFAGMFFLIILYMALLCLMTAAALEVTDRSALYLISSLIFIQGVQVFLNLAVVSGIAPSTGLNLPFFSQGGTSLMANIAAIGLFFTAVTHIQPKRLRSP